MKAPSIVSLLGLVLSVAVTTRAEQTTFGVTLSSSSGSGQTGEIASRPKRRPLKGRFLHVTDFHPDIHYKTGATFDSGCHRLKKKKGKGKGKKGEDKLADLAEDEVEEEEEEEEGRWESAGGGGGEGDEGGLKKDKDGVDLAGKWGTAVSKCDSPMSLVNLTFDWLNKEWANEIDFVVWTGDNARHDIDRDIPRSPKEIFDSNRMMVEKMLETFGPDVPIVPSIGNNDIWPHNVLAAGPNHITEEFLHIWSKFIPSDYSHVFERGAYYSAEVIPDRLAVISLNTLFWYDSNTLVDGCGDNSNDPGALEMDWLDVQLSSFRERGMQVWLTGHVPPHMGYYYDNCYLRYGDLALRYQDTIVGHLFGHMNIDHFFFIDVDELESTPVGDKSKLSSMANLTSIPDYLTPLGPQLSSDGQMRVMGGQTLMEELRKDFEDMPSTKKLKLKDYIAVNVAASVIPTYLPGVRVFSYNITGLENDLVDEDVFYRPSPNPSNEDDDVDQGEKEDFAVTSELTDVDEDREEHELKKNRRPGHRHGRPKSDCSRPENEDKPHCVFKHKPRYYSKNSPSRSNRPLTPLGYTQFYLPKIDKQTEETPEWQVEYTTFKQSILVPSDDEGGIGNDTEVGEWGQPYPIPLHLLPNYDPEFYQVTSTSTSQLVSESAPELESEPESASVSRKGKKHGDDNDDGDDDEDEKKKKKKRFQKGLKKITPWKMKDLTIPSYVKLSRKLVGEKKMWDRFSELMFVSSDPN